MCDNIDDKNMITGIVFHGVVPTTFLLKIGPHVYFIIQFKWFIFYSKWFIFVDCGNNACL